MEFKLLLNVVYISRTFKTASISSTSFVFLPTTSFHLFPYYRPQRSWGKVIFSQASVKGGCYPGMHCRWYPSMPCSRSPGGGVVSQHALQFSRLTAKGEVEGDLVQGPHPRGKLKGIWPGVPAPRMPAVGACS